MAKTKRILQKEQTREQLIEAAMVKFTQDGLLGARTSDIAELAGVAHGTVFVHFADRDDLLCSVIQEFGLKVAGRIHELAGGGGSLQEILEAHLDGLRENERFYTRLVKEGQMLPAPARNTLVMIQSAISFHLLDAAEREMKDGKIRRMPIHLLFNTWVGLLHYYLANDDFFAPGGSVLASQGPDLLRHFLTLIAF